MAFICFKTKISWFEMREQSYDSEALLQTLLARYPNLLAGDQIGGTAPRRWLVGQMLDYAANGVAYWPMESRGRGSKRAVLQRRGPSG